MSADVRAGLRISLVGMGLSGVLAVVKLVTGLLGNSYALIADAVESFADIFSSAIVWSGLAIAAKPPDEDHPYGHGRAEALAALAVGMMLIGAAIGIAVKALDGILAPHEAPAGYTLIVLAAVVAIKEGMFRIASRIGKRIGSTAVSADAWHHRSDAVTSLLAAVGISVSLFAGPGYEGADEWAALAATVIIGFNGQRFVRLALAELMDRSPGPELLERVRSTAAGVKGVEGIEKLLARKMGTTYLVDMHVEVDGGLSVSIAHEVGHQVKDEVRRHHPEVADVLVHIEPAPRATEG
ncbi:MAG TPA: cation diffusion facilitator family transporter [Phycisphaerae bacterium]|nr:cation diffusion facilitator family transporter [Phycisphaerae bacterium]